MKKQTRIYTFTRTVGDRAEYAPPIVIEGELLPYLPENTVFYLANSGGYYAIKKCSLTYSPQTNMATMEYYIW